VNPNLNFGNMDTTLNQSDGAAAFTQLIDVGEEVYTINIQQPVIIWILRPCKPSATNPLPHPLYTLIPFPTDGV